MSETTKCNGCGGDHAKDLVPGSDTFWHEAGVVGLIKSPSNKAVLVSIRQKDDKGASRHSVMTLEGAEGLARLILDQVHKAGYVQWER